MTKYGVKFTQAGVPIDRAADYQKVLDSDWRGLEILQTFKATPILNKKNNLNEFVKVASHNAGFLPAFEIAGADGQAFSDENFIYIQIYHGSGYADYFTSGAIRVYNYPITDSYQAPSEPTTSKSGPDTTYGVKFVDDQSNGRIDDYETWKFSINTKAKALNVHQSDILLNKTNPRNSNVAFPTWLDFSYGGTLGEFGIEHNLGYPPTFFLAPMNYYSDLSTYLAPIYSASIGPNTTVGPMSSLDSGCVCYADYRYIKWRGVQSILYYDYACIILKDPVEIIG